MRNRMIGLVIAGFVLTLSPTSRSANAADIFNNTNTLTVSNCPQPVVNCSPQFTLSASTTITEVVTYHKQGGAPAGKNISLKDAASGSPAAGPFQVTVHPATPGFENWIATVGQTVPAGTYAIVDSQADTWQQNAQSGNKGFAIVRGTPAAPSTDESITDCTASCTRPPAGPLFACSAHGPHSTCNKAAPSAESPGGGVTCTDGKNTTTCNCQLGCTTH